VSAENATVAVDYLTRLPGGAARRQELTVVTRRKTDILTFGLIGRRQPGAAGPRAHRGLGELAQRQQETLQGLGGYAPEHIRLVLVEVATTRDARLACHTHHPRVVPSGYPGRPEVVGQRDEPPQATRIAGDAGVRRLAGQVRADERRHDLGFEARHVVHAEVRAADGVRAFPGTRHGCRRTAAALVVSRPELQGGGAHLVAGLAQRERGYGAVNAAAQANDYAFFPSTFATSPARPALVR
jgi:hypothetical protein